MNQAIISFFKIAGAVFSIAVSAQITVDIGPIPITGQTLGILIWAFFLSPKESFLALSIYLMIGFLGIPVFADGGHGIDKLYGGSGGFLIGFVIAATLVSYLSENKKMPSVNKILSLTTLGTIIIMICGVARLATIYGIKDGIAYGFLPFWKGAIIKIIIGTFIVWSINTVFLVKNKITDK